MLVHLRFELLDLAYRVGGRELVLGLIFGHPLRSAPRTADISLHDVRNRFAHAPRCDAVRLVVRDLLASPTLGFAYRAFHRAGYMVGVEDGLAAEVARGAADRLNQRPLGAQKAFLVGVENGDQRYLGDIQPLTEQVDADQNVEFA